MALTHNQIVQVENVLRNSLRHKFQNYHPEPASMPFHTRLLGKDRLALYSFIHSLNTNFGTSIFEPVALSLASTSFASAQSQQTAGRQILQRRIVLFKILWMDFQRLKQLLIKLKKSMQLRVVCQTGEMRTVKPTKVDVKLIGHDGTIYLFDIKTAKPNAGGFKEFKRTLLEWVATTLAVNPEANVQTVIAIPYNPYEPEPYTRWTMRGMLDLENELKVANEFWDFLGGEGAYTDLLNIFERIGIELRPEIDAYFARYNSH